MWTSFHLYYEPPHDVFLVRVLFPFVKDILKKELAQQYFFVRYWEKGWHIRLRFKTNNETKLKPIVVDFFEKYFDENPRKRKKNISEYFPENSVQCIKYEPEIERYGGERGIQPAEKQFMAASNAVLSAMSDSELWNYETALGTAIQLHLIFAKAIQFSKKETTLLFKKVMYDWLPNAYDLVQNQEKLFATFDRLLKEQAPVLTKFIHDFWQEDYITNIWFCEMNEVYHDLKRLEIKSTENILNQYSSYIHMMNNRLGILNEDEAYLAYLLTNILEEI